MTEAHRRSRRGRRRSSRRAPDRRAVRARPTTRAASPTPSRVSAKPTSPTTLASAGRHVRVADPQHPEPSGGRVVGHPRVGRRPVVGVQAEAAREGVGRKPEDRRAPRPANGDDHHHLAPAEVESAEVVEHGRDTRARPRTRARSRRRRARRRARAWSPRPRAGPGNHASANDIAASTHARVAQARRGPVAIASGTTAAATMPHGASPAPARPGVEMQHRTRTTSDAARLRAERGRVGADQRERPRREQQHGTDRVATTAPTTARPALRAPPHERQRQCRTRPRSRARAATRAATPTPRPRPAARRVHTDVDAAPRATAPRPDRRVVARTNAPSTNGASGEEHSGPSSPCQIAFRAIGLAAYAAAAAMPGNDDDANGRSSRYAPNAPSGSAPPTTIDCARPGMVEQHRTRRGHERVQRGSRANAAPIIVVRQDAGERRPRRADAGPGLERTDLAVRGPTSSDREPNSTQHGQHDAIERAGAAACAGRPRPCAPACASTPREPLPRVDPFEHEPAQARAAADHEIAHVAVVDRGAARCVADARPPELARMRKRRQPSDHDRAGPRDPTGHEQADGFERGSARTRRAGPRSSASAEYDLQSRRTRASGSRRGDRSAIARSALWRADDRRRRRAVRERAAAGATMTRAPGEAGPPAEIDVVGARERWRGRSRRARGRGRRARASPRARRRRRRGRRRAVPGRPHRARGPRTATP